MANDDRDYFKTQYKKLFEMLSERRAERDDRQAELEVLNQEIVQLEQLLSGIDQLISDPTKRQRDSFVINGLDEQGLGLAEACRIVLRTVKDYQTARGIRDCLEESGYDLTQHANPLASIHGVLKRLFESGDAEQLEAGGKTFYRWKSVPIGRRSPTREEVAAETGNLQTIGRRRGSKLSDLKGMRTLTSEDFKKKL